MNIKTQIVIHILLLFLSIKSLNAQIVNDSLNYSELRNNELTEDGSISVITKHYKFDPKKDSVFIFNQGKLVLSKQTNVLFNKFNEHKFTSYNTQKNELELFDASTIQTLVISNVTKPIIIPKHSLIFFLDSSTNSYRLTKVSRNKVKEIWSEKKSNISFINISDDQQILLIQRNDIEQGIELINLLNLKKTVNRDIIHPIKQVKWSKKHPVVFLLPTPFGNNQYPFLTFYNYHTNQNFRQNLNQDSFFNDIETTSDSSFKIIENTFSKKKPYNKDEVELWSTTDRYLRNALSNSNTNEYSINRHIVFNYKNKRVYQPQELDNHESVSLNENTLLVYDSNQYLDYTHSWSSRPRDISLYDIKNHNLTIITKKQESPFNTTSLSPRGNYFVYIKNNKLFFYNINNKSLENTFELHEDNQKLRVFVQRLRTWSSDERYFYFVSNSNLMRYDTKNKTFKIVIDSNNITSRYELINPLTTSIFNDNSELHYRAILNDNKLIILKLNINENTRSLIVVDNGKQSETIVKNTKDLISNVKYSKDLKSFTFTLENFNKPKTVFIYKNGRTRQLFKNSMPEEYYTWKQQKIVTYKDKYGNNLKGILFYPKDFNRNNKYPMITHIYEIQNSIANKFLYPTYLNRSGFNTDIYLEKSYFVFYPDILTTQQEGPGLSALNCLEISLKTILKEEKAIDKDKLGLIGYSFGGYATNFIITQLHIFKAAVSGFGSGDIVNSYFSYNENFTSPNYFLFENGQFNLGSFKENKELFLLNSPILFADQIKTPLLGFAGKEDRNVEWKLQQEFFIALLRFRKPHISLFYKNEAHGFSKKENQVDITKRTMDWFDYFLKNKDTEQTNWIKSNIFFEENRIIN